MIQVVGARGTINDVDRFLTQVRGFSQTFHCVIQVFDATLIYGKEHLYSAVTHALRAMERKTNTANSLEMEIMLYASGFILASERSSMIWCLVLVSLLIL